MSKSQVTPSEASSGYNPWAFEPMLHQEFNVLKARLMNLAETMARDDKQANAIKGLMKDFVNKAYYGSHRSIEDYARYFKIIEESDVKSSAMSLEASSLEEILHS
jgi:hypothetical protein